jgi:hypothetical protein
VHGGRSTLTAGAVAARGMATENVVRSLVQKLAEHTVLNEHSPFPAADLSFHSLKNVVSKKYECEDSCGREQIRYASCVNIGGVQETDV